MSVEDIVLVNLDIVIEENNNSITESYIPWGFSYFLVGSISKGPMRSSLKKPKNKDNASIDSTTSSKRVRIQLNQEQSSVWNHLTIQGIFTIH